MKDGEKNIKVGSRKTVKELSDKSLDSVSGGKLFIGRKEETNINMQNSHNTDNSNTLVIGDGANVTIGGTLDM